MLYLVVILIDWQLTPEHYSQGCSSKYIFLLLNKLLKFLSSVFYFKVGSATSLQTVEWKTFARRQNFFQSNLWLFNDGWSMQSLALFLISQNGFTVHQANFCKECNLSASSVNIKILVSFIWADRESELCKGFAEKENLYTTQSCSVSYPVCQFSGFNFCINVESVN